MFGLLVRARASQVADDLLDRLGAAPGAWRLAPGLAGGRREIREWSSGLICWLIIIIVIEWASPSVRLNKLQIGRRWRALAKIGRRLAKPDCAAGTEGARARGILAPASDAYCYRPQSIIIVCRPIRGARANGARVTALMSELTFANVRRKWSPASGGSGAAVLATELWRAT